MTTIQPDSEPITEQILLAALAVAIALWFTVVAYATGTFIDTHYRLAYTLMDDPDQWRHVVRLVVGFVATGLLFEVMYALRVDRSDLS